MASVSKDPHLFGQSNTRTDARDTLAHARRLVGVSQRVMGPIGVTAGVERQFLSYRWRRALVLDPEPEVVSMATPRHDTSDMFSGGITVALPRGFRLALTAEHIRRHSKVDDLLNYQRTRLLSTITIGS